MVYRKHIGVVLTAAFLCSCIFPTRNVLASPLLGLPEPGIMVSLSPAYQPAIIRGVTVHADNPFLFDFILDPGQEQWAGNALKEQTNRLVKYFMAALAVPAKDMWVNLSPYEKGRVVSDALGQTDMGQDLLAQDYMLKQITASLIYPERDLGKKFWDKVYAQVQVKYGSSVNIPVNTFNKVWITSDKAEVFEHGQTAFVTASHLKVMLAEDYEAQRRSLASKAGGLEQDYLASQKHTVVPTVSKQTATEQAIREIVIPQIEQEVNQGKNFAQLRQIFNVIILANWYKNNLKNALLNDVYANQSKVKGIDLTDKTTKEQIYYRYIQAYKKGVFNYIKESNTLEGQVVPRKYFSGGIDQGMAAKPDIVHNEAMIGGKLPNAQGFFKVGVGLVPNQSRDLASVSPYDDLVDLKDEFGAHIASVPLDLAEQVYAAIIKINAEGGKTKAALTLILERLRREYMELRTGYANRLPPIEPFRAAVALLAGTAIVNPQGRIDTNRTSIILASFNPDNSVRDPLFSTHLDPNKSWLLSALDTASKKTVFRVAKTLANRNIYLDLSAVLSNVAGVQSVELYPREKLGEYKQLVKAKKGQAIYMDDFGNPRAEYSLNLDIHGDDQGFIITLNSGDQIFVIARTFLEQRDDTNRVKPQIDNYDRLDIRFGVWPKESSTLGSANVIEMTDQYGQLGYLDKNQVEAVLGDIERILQTPGDYRWRAISQIVHALFKERINFAEGYDFISVSNAIDIIEASKALIGTTIVDAKGKLNPGTMKILLASFSFDGELLTKFTNPITHQSQTLDDPSIKDAAQVTVTVNNMNVQGGIDLKKTQEKTLVRKEGVGVVMKVDPVMIEQIKREGIESLSPRILNMTPISNLWPLLGLVTPK